ncbi:MAG: tyrosine-type recombinase/integrase [Alphaproteobacteria bacterium]|nr:tyrosine-type recombinase/integrase [Alphaproteobacteria bacterium]
MAIFRQQVDLTGAREELCVFDADLHVRRTLNDQHGAYSAAGLTDECTTHGLRYTAATILRELGCEWPMIASITGHETAEMARKYSEKKRFASMAVARLDEARNGQKGNENQG